MLCVVAGYGILISDASAAVKYFAIFLTVAGVSPCISMAITWIGTQRVAFLARLSKRF
jgi:hypothetical protein